FNPGGSCTGPNKHTRSLRRLLARTLPLPWKCPILRQLWAEILRGLLGAADGRCSPPELPEVPRTLPVIELRRITQPPRPAPSSTVRRSAPATPCRAPTATLLGPHPVRSLVEGVMKLPRFRVWMLMLGVAVIALSSWLVAENWVRAQAR